ncbi:PKD domain-containing protein [Aridibaculum aurantiacum]|uniref:PKD domain-containing protein n=1 Tax=Aridibaculum aurantiacum TaxID=2810307 RepID=UPI001A97AD9C|nr:PKD domain-containing protein [Aridibaculum aurantiacum]
MKKTSILFFLLLISIIHFGQEKRMTSLLPDASKQATKNGVASSKSALQRVTCGTDTLLYPYYKELSFSATNDSFFLDAMVGNVRTASQAYITSENVNIVGVQFWAATYTNGVANKSIPVVVSVWSVDAQYRPTTEIASTTVNISSNYEFYKAIFPSPVQVSNNYAVSVRASNNSDTLAVVTNNAGAGWQMTDYGEGLAWRRFGSGTWNSSEAFFGQDLEYMIFPIVNYSVSTTFTAPTTGNVDNTIQFNNTSSNLFSNRMYNLHVFNDYFDITPADSTFRWNYGDNSALSYTRNGSHSYTSPGTYTVNLAGQIAGYYTTCNSDSSSTIAIQNSLPVKLTSFDVIKANGAARVVWTTASEVGFSHFEIERSLDGRNFAVIGNVQARGSSSNGSGYEFGDNNIKASTLFYRLKMIDKDVTFSYSDIVVVRFSGKGGLNIETSFVRGDNLNVVYHNPVAGKVTLEVFDMSGKRLSTNTQQAAVGTNNFMVPTTKLNTGVLVVMISNGTERVQTRVVK